MKNNLSGSQPGEFLSSSVKKEGQDILSTWRRFGLIGGRCLAIIATALTVCSGTVNAAPTPTLAATDGPMQIGQPLTNFVKTYGQPVDGQTFRNKTLLVFTYSRSHTNPKLLAEGVVDNNADGKGWADINEAAKVCEAYMPKDAQFQKTVPVSGGDQRIYTSQSLASIFQKGDFVDETNDQQLVSPGTFHIFYETNNQHIDSCDVGLGISRPFDDSKGS